MYSSKLEVKIFGSNFKVLKDFLFCCIQQTRSIGSAFNGKTSKKQILTYKTMIAMFSFIKQILISTQIENRATLFHTNFFSFHFDMFGSSIALTDHIQVYNARVLYCSMQFIRSVVSKTVC